MPCFFYYHIALSEGFEGERHAAKKEPVPNGIGSF